MINKEMADKIDSLYSNGLGCRAIGEKLNLSNLEFNKKQDQIKEEENLKIAKKEKYLRLFLETFKSEMHKGKAKKVLYRMVRYSDIGILERFKFLEQIKSIYFRTAYEKESHYNKDSELIEKMVYRVYTLKDSFYNITKTEYDYLNFLRGLI